MRLAATRTPRMIEPSVQPGERGLAPRRAAAAREDSMHLRRTLASLLALLALSSALGLLAGPPAPVVTEPGGDVSGALVIVGGGAMPDDVRDQFIKLGGGDKARLVVIPTASATGGE